MLIQSNKGINDKPTFIEKCLRPLPVFGSCFLLLAGVPILEDLEPGSCEYELDAAAAAAIVKRLNPPVEVEVSAKSMDTSPEALEAAALSMEGCPTAVDPADVEVLV